MRRSLWKTKWNRKEKEWKRRKTTCLWWPLLCWLWGYSDEIAGLVKKLRETLKKWKFNRTAKCLFSEELKDYDKLHEMPCLIAKLKCEKFCKEREMGIHPARFWNIADIAGFIAVKNVTSLRPAINLNRLKNSMGIPAWRTWKLSKNGNWSLG